MQRRRAETPDMLGEAMALVEGAAAAGRDVRRTRTLESGFLGVALLFLGSLTAAAEEITVEVEVIPIEEPLLDTSVSLPDGDFVAVTASGDIVWVDAKTGQTTFRYDWPPEGLTQRHVRRG